MKEVSRSMTIRMRKRNRECLIFSSLLTRVFAVFSSLVLSFFFLLLGLLLTFHLQLISFIRKHRRKTTPVKSLVSMSIFHLDMQRFVYLHLTSNQATVAFTRKRIKMIQASLEVRDEQRVVQIICFPRFSHGQIS